MVAVGDKGDGRGLWGQGCVFADFMRSCWLSEGCGRPRRPCPRLLHSEPSRLAVVTAFSLKLAATLEGAGVGVVGGSEHSAGAVLSAAAAAVGAAAVGAAAVGGSEHSAHSAGVGAGAGAEGVGVVASSVGVAAARIWAR